MLDAISIAAIGMENDLQRLNSISQNLANVSTTGYKRQVAVTRSFDALMGGVVNPNPAARETDTVATDHAVGTLRRTGNPMQVAVDGEGFFEVATERGLAYMRQGTLRIDAGGRIVTEQGHALMGNGGELRANGTAFEIAANGDIRQEDRILGQIKLVRFADTKALKELGNGMFSQGQARFDDKGALGQIRAGYQENSNVNSAQEMVRLSETVRHFESMQKIVQGYEDAMDKALRKLGEF